MHHAAKGYECPLRGASRCYWGTAKVAIINEENNATMQVNAGKKILSEFLSFLKYKVDNDLLTMEEVESLVRMIEENLTVIGTSADFAKFYGQSRTNISSVINRRMIEKPIRKVYYSFKAFRKIIPDKWRNHT